MNVWKTTRSGNPSTTFEIQTVALEILHHTNLAPNSMCTQPYATYRVQLVTRPLHDAWVMRRSGSNLQRHPDRQGERPCSPSALKSLHFTPRPPSGTRPGTFPDDGGRTCAPRGLTSPPPHWGRLPTLLAIGPRWELQRIGENPEFCPWD